MCGLFSVYIVFELGVYMDHVFAHDKKYDIAL